MLAAVFVRIAFNWENEFVVWEIWAWWLQTAATFRGPKGRKMVRFHLP